MSDTESDTSDRLILKTEEEVLGLLEELGDLESDEPFMDTIVFDPVKSVKPLILPYFEKTTSTAKFLDIEHFLYYLEHVTNSIYYQDGSVYPMSSNTQSFIKIRLGEMRGEISSQLRNILRENTSQFIVVPIGLYFPNITQNYLATPGRLATSGHANVLIIDNQKRVIEYFEPHGKIMSGIGKTIDIHFILITLLTNVSSKYKDYKFMNASDKCLFGIQEIQSIYESLGHCLAWSLLYLHLRLINPKLDSQEIIVRFTNNFTIPEQLHLIKRYISTVEHYYYANQGDPVTFMEFGLIISNETEQKMSMRLIELVRQYSILLDQGNFQQATFLFEELQMYKKLPLFHATMAAMCKFSK